MRVGVFIDQPPAETGGASSFVRTILNSLLSGNQKNEFFMIVPDGPTDAGKRILSLSGAVRVSLKQRAIRILRSKLLRSHRSQEELPTMRLNALIASHSLEMIFFLTPYFIRCNAPMVITVWDLAHRIYPFFPEVNFVGWRWEDREHFYRQCLPMATFIVTGTETGKRQIMQFYGIHPERIKVIPLPTPPISHEKNLRTGGSSLERIYKKRYLFYPAQFWPHKNHANLLLALQLARKKVRNLEIVFCGSDQGNLENIKSLAASHGLSESVHFLGFVERGDLFSLYRNSIALIFPSFFGPDNLPTLEAMSLGVPVLTANIEGAKDQLGNAALFFQPESPESIAKAIFSVATNSSNRKMLIRRGYNLTRKRTSDHYVAKLNDIFSEFEAMRRCW